MALPPMDEGKHLSEALNTVKIQFQQMKRNLVHPQSLLDTSTVLILVVPYTGVGSAHGRVEERQFDAC